MMTIFDFITITVCLLKWFRFMNIPWYIVLGCVVIDIILNFFKPVGGPK